MKLSRILFFVLCSIGAQAQSSINLIPQPVSLQPQNGVFVLSKATTIHYNQAEAKAAADMLSQRLNGSTGFGLKAQSGKTGKIQLNLNRHA